MYRLWDNLLVTILAANVGARYLIELATRRGPTGVIREWPNNRNEGYSPGQDDIGRKVMALNLSTGRVTTAYEISIKYYPQHLSAICRINHMRAALFANNSW